MVRQKIAEGRWIFWEVSQLNNSSRCDRALQGTKRSQRARIFRSGGNDQRAVRKKEGGKKKKTNQNGMLIFGHSGIKGFKTKGVKKGVSSIINSQS